MADLADGESVEMQGSARKPYILKNTGGVYSCTCPAWRNQSAAIDQRTCKHLKKLRGEDAELQRVGAPPARTPKKKSSSKSGASGGSSAASGKKAPPLLLAHSWDNSTDVTGWWMSEKLDGVRAYWDGTQFVSRLGNRYIAPDWFVDGLPELPLDGELWVGRKKFQKTVSIVRRADAGESWRDVQYLIFDAPGHGGLFEERVAFLEQYFADHPSDHARVLAHEPCTDLAHMQAELARVEGLGGEGLMLRKPRSRYEVGRSTTLLKVKTFHDAEAKVIGHLAGAGRHKGRLGALRVVTPGGVEFSVGTGLSDAERRDPPAIGAIITYRYQELTDIGVPRFPSYVGERHDFAWPGDSDAGPETATETAGTAKKPAKKKPAPARKPAKKKKAAATGSKSAASRGAVAASAAPLPTVPEADAESTVRYLELSDGKSSKFWEVTVTGNQHVVRYGRIGVAGTRKLKTFASPEAAQADADRLADSKIKKGYREAAADEA